MGKVIGIPSPYSILFIAVFLEYFPALYGDIRPSISLGPISIFITDFSFLYLIGYTLISSAFRRGRLPPSISSAGRVILILFAVFFILACFKWLVQTNHDINSIRMMVPFSIGYPFLFLFPILVWRKDDLRRLHVWLIIFLVYIFALHLYGFSTQGYKLHILSGAFLTMLSVLYFLTLVGSNLFRLSAPIAFLIKALVIVAYFMVGHRSGLIGLMLGLVTLSFFDFKLAIKETAVFMLIGVMGFGAAAIISPNTLSNVTERASTTFDTQQETYQGRFNNLFLIAEVSSQHPFIGKPLTTVESRSETRGTVREGNRTVTRNRALMMPHNLAFEWLLFFGIIGLLVGVMLIIVSLMDFKKFLADFRGDSDYYRIGVALLCTMAHNLFFALTNVTIDSPFGTFFLYFPIVIMVSMRRNERIIRS